MTDHTPFDKLLEPVFNRLKALSMVEIAQLRSVLERHAQAVLEPPLQAGQPPVLLSQLLRDSPAEPSEPLLEVAALLDAWLTPPKFDLLLEAFLDQLCEH